MQPYDLPDDFGPIIIKPGSFQNGNLSIQSTAYLLDSPTINSCRLYDGLNSSGILCCKKSLIIIYLKYFFLALIK